MNWVSELAISLIGSGGVALVVVLVERHYAKKAAKRDLEHLLGTGDAFVRFDLRGRNLSRAYLVAKDFSGARFGGANLKGADLAGAILSRASLKGADLRGTNFRGQPPPRYPSETSYPGENVYPSGGAPAGTPQVGDATLDDIDVGDATYDDRTQWPKDFDPNEAGAVHVKKRTLRWRFRHLGWGRVS